GQRLRSPRIGGVQRGRRRAKRRALFRCRGEMRLRSRARQSRQSSFAGGLFLPPRVSPGVFVNRPCLRLFFRKQARTQPMMPLLQTTDYKALGALEARSGRDGCKLGRQRKANVLANEIEIALIRKAVFGEALADLLDQNFEGGSASSKANTFYAFEPLRIDV